jgi:hypothetical protein
VTTKLSFFNDALLACGERFLASVSENQESRHLLDQVYASGGVEYCLERGQWNFATRTVALDYETGIEPPFGFSRAFTQPTDYCCTRAVCADEFFRVPLKGHQHTHEANYFYADLDTIYLRYVSKDPLYGLNLNLWPQTFLDVVAIHFASKIAKKLGHSQAEKEALEKERDKLLKEAKNSDAQREGVQFPQPGMWARARTGYGSSRRDGGGTTGDLIG